MDKDSVLSNEEKDALIKAGQQNDDPLSGLIGSSDGERRRFDRHGLQEMLDCIVAGFMTEFEKGFSLFLRKKIGVSLAFSKYGIVHDFINEDKRGTVFNLYYVLSGNYFIVISAGYGLMHQILNVLFGGQVNAEEAIIETPGKVGFIISERMSEVILKAFSAAVSDYGNVDYQHVKTSDLPLLVTRMSQEDRVYAIEVELQIDGYSSVVNIMITADFLHSMRPQDIHNSNASQDVDAKQSIRSLLLDSKVMVVASLPEIRMEASRLLELKPGDLLPIAAPSNVNIIIDNLIAFSGVTYQSNAGLVVKIEDSFI